MSGLCAEVVGVFAFVLVDLRGLWVIGGVKGCGIDLPFVVGGWFSGLVVSLVGFLLFAFVYNL